MQFSLAFGILTLLRDFSLWFYSKAQNIEISSPVVYAVALHLFDMSSENFILRVFLARKDDELLISISLNSNVSLQQA